MFGAKRSAILDELQVAGVGMNPDDRLETANEIATVTRYVQSYCSKDATCVVSACLGGARDTSDFGLLESEALSAQAACSTEVTFDDAVAYVERADPQFADWLRAKAKAAATKVRIQDERTAKEAQEKVIDELGNAASDLGGATVSTVGFFAKHIVAIGLLALVAVATVAVVVTSKARD